MTYPFPLGSRCCNATDEDIECDQAATYVVTVEEDDNEGSRAVESRHTCGWHLPSAVDWAGNLTTPFTGEADDVYRTLHERRVTVARSADNPETEDNPAVALHQPLLRADWVGGAARPRPARIRIHTSARPGTLAPMLLM